ncbi:MAG: ACP S-malonyltransferase [Proteobacteria bacterium]|nr:ACP S-malonyltransferase [Pseudomonadota bacterium]
MSAVIGLDDDKVKDICNAASTGNDCLVVPANFNAPSQVVIAGHAAGVDRFAKLANGSDNPHWKARKIIPLNVSAPFHCPLMADTANAFLPFLEKINWSDPQFPIVSNLDAKLRNTGNVSSILKDQIDHPVLWTSCVQTLERHGIKTYIEMGPSRVLSGLVKRIVEGASTLSIDSLEDFQKLESFLKETQNAAS